MAGIRAWLTRFTGLFGRGNGDAELTDELNGHLDAHIDDNIRAGMSPDEARRVALLVLLAAIGIYSVLSYGVGQRISEIRIRRALGAPVATLVRNVVGDGMKPALVGIVIGLAAAAALGRVMTTLLFGVGPHDAVTLMGVSIAVVLIALLAAVVPAYRATRINPLQALRTE